VQSSFCWEEFVGGSATVGTSEVGSDMIIVVTDPGTGDTVIIGGGPIVDPVFDVTFPGILFPVGTYNLAWTIDDGTCLSEPLITQVVIADIPVAPLMVDTVEICEGETATLFAFGDFDSTSFVTWYNNNCCY